jgi:hypothetical protein
MAEVGKWRVIDVLQGRKMHLRGAARHCPGGAGRNPRTFATDTAPDRT